MMVAGLLSGPWHSDEAAYQASGGQPFSLSKYNIDIRPSHIVSALSLGEGTVQGQFKCVLGHSMVWKRLLI